MSCFVIFDKRGLVIHSEGEVPSYMNDLIISINPQDPRGSRRVRDDLMEYEIRGQVVYLALDRREVLAGKIEKFEPAVGRLKENERITTTTTTEEHMGPGSREGGGSKKKVSRREMEAKRMEELDYGEGRGSSVGRLVEEAARRIDIKRVFRLFTGRIRLEDLRQRMEEHLIRKNVEMSFSKLITDDVIAQCRSTGLDEISEREFRGKMRETIGKLLPTADPEDLLRQIRKHGTGYSVCFVGVNGVGKSTSLAKVACWLMKSGLRVYIAACDTFRAGAIEQLKVHVERFKQGGHDVGFYESGYSKDDATVARAAISAAVRGNYDVILIDTAGRMHKKENLMQSLSRLIKMNSPDQIIFVGEALVGGDSLSHIREFNRWISDGSQGRKIDSIILTKVDTVDDKIGQVVNMSFSASSPVLFLGVGQTNSDLVPMDSEYISNLLSS